MSGQLRDILPANSTPLVGLSLSNNSKQGFDYEGKQDIHSLYYAKEYLILYSWVSTRYSKVQRAKQVSLVESLVQSCDVCAKMQTDDREPMIEIPVPFLTLGKTDN